MAVEFHAFRPDFVEVNSESSVFVNQPAAFYEFLAGPLISGFVHACLLEDPFCTDSEVAVSCGPDKQAHQFDLVAALAVQFVEDVGHEYLRKLPESVGEVDEFLAPVYKARGLPVIF